MRRIFAWQKRPRWGRRGEAIPTSGFTLMFTTVVGPPDLNEDYLNMLRSYLRKNVEGHSTFRDRLEARIGSSDLMRIERDHFDVFFSLAAPKLIASLLDELDWFVDPSPGIQVYEFERSRETGPYKMLHMAMHVRRKNPPIERRAPGQDCPPAQHAYRSVVERLFAQGSTSVTHAVIDVASLRADLEAIKQHRRNIYPEGE